ncbi:MAG: FtsX-like permease family protein [Firmicutes bacterium]|nr:FtsX-like permease family protein [Bacillota bacterium]
MVLNKRIMRELLANGVRNLLMIAIIVLSMMLVVSLCSSTDSITKSITNMWKECNVEDGSFETYTPLSKRNFNELSELNVHIEEAYYSDIETNGSILRVFHNRRNIDLLYPEYGRLPSNNKELFLEKMYAKNHNIFVGDTLYIGKQQFSVSGIGCLPDYGYVKQNSSDVAPNDEFGIVVLTDSAFNKTVACNNLIYHYTFKLGEGCTVRDLKDKLKRLDFDLLSVKDTYIRAQIEKGIVPDTVNISAFEDAKYNIRINDAIEDAQISKSSALIMGVILLILLVYMLAIFSSGTIEQERSVIGTLYALGYSRKEILKYYMSTPMIISGAGALIGMISGFLMTDTMSASSEALYSIPSIQHTYPPYLVCYALGMPIALAYIINWFVLSKKLNATPLAMMRKMPSGKASIGPALDNISFGAKFRIRQFLRELKGNITLFAGVILSLLLILFSVACYGSLKGYIDGVENDIHYNYMYILRNPVTDLPKHSELGFTKGFYVNFPMTSSEMEVTLMGIDYDNPYFDFAPYMSDNPNDVYVSSSAVIKFGYEVGDEVVLKDISSDKYYAFNIAGECEYSGGLYFFMNIDAMREAFGLLYFDPDDLDTGERRPARDTYYYNTVFSDSKIDFKHNMLLSEVAKEDVKYGANKFMTLMAGMIVMLIGVSVLIFISVMYLLMKLEIDRSRSSISLLKALGYDRKTVHSFYIGNSFYITLAAVAFGIPLCKKIVDAIYPYAVSNVNGGFKAVISSFHYILVLLIILLSYLVTRLMLVRYLEKINLSEILKDRE